MQIVIDVPDDTFEILSRKKNLTIDELIILNGTPLPKGHGRLIDVDALYKELEFPTRRFGDAFKEILDDAQTIIEADTDGSDGE